MAEKKITKKTAKKKVEQPVVLPVVSMDEVIKLLENKSLNQEQHMKILSLCLKDIGYFPIEDTLRKKADGTILFKGNPLTTEEIITLRAHIHSLKDNIAFQMFSEQITFDAIKEGMYISDTIPKLMFGKAAIYMVTKFKEYIANFDNQ